MSQISGLSPGGIPVTGEPIRVDRALTQSVSQAVARLNEAQFAGEGREITFAVDAATKKPIVRVVDVSTKEVVHQWPAEYVLRLDAAGTKNLR